MACPHYFVAAF